MSNRRASSGQVRYSRPSLESLEERTLLSTTGDFLAGFADTVYRNVPTGVALVKSVNQDSTDFDNAPNLNNFLRLAVDTIKLQNVAATMSNQVNTLATIVDFAEIFDSVTGLTGPEASFLDKTVSFAKKEAAQLQNAADQAEGDLIAAFFGLGAGHAAVPPLPTPTTPPATPTTPTSGHIAANYSDAPATASASGPDLTESVFVTNMQDVAVTATISYAANDGTTGGPVSKTIAAGTSDTVSLTVMPCSAGVVGQWTVQVGDLDPHHNSTTFTP
jgi:hypothetical protein